MELKAEAKLEDRRSRPLKTKEVKMLILLAKVLYVLISLVMLPGDLLKALLYKAIYASEIKKQLKALSAMLGKEITLEDLKKFHQEQQ